MVKNLTANAEVDLIPGLRRCPGEGNGNLLQYSCLGNPTDRGAWQAGTVHGVEKSRTGLTDQPTHTHTHTHTHTLSGKNYLGEEFLGIGPLVHFLAFCSHPQNLQGAGGCVLFSGLVGSNQFLLYP